MAQQVCSSRIKDTCRLWKTFLQFQHDSFELGFCESVGGLLKDCPDQIPHFWLSRFWIMGENATFQLRQNGLERSQ